MKDGNSKCGIYSGDLQEKQKCNSNESNPFTLTDGPVNESSRSYGLPSKSGKRKLLGLEMVKKINSGTCANATKPAKSLDQELGSEFIPDESKVVCQKREAMKEKIYEESHYRASKRLPETSYTNLEVNWQTACTVLKCSGQGAVNESKYSDDLGNNTSRINQQGQKWPNQGDIFDDEKGAEGLKKGDESLRNTIDRGEELSLSEEDVSSSLLDEDLDFSESDPMEECFRIFNESSKQETKDSGTEAKQNVTAAKTKPDVQESTKAKIAVPGQKKRIAHISKFAKEKSVCRRVIVPCSLPMPKLQRRNRIVQVQQQAIQLTANVKGAQAYKAATTSSAAPTCSKKILVQGAIPPPVGAIKSALNKICCRCGALFSVTPGGSYISKKECKYHWEPAQTQRVPGGWEIQYSCCKGSLGSDGCEVAKLCKTSVNENKTFLRLMPLDGNPGVFAVHCEMCYTRHGMEIARVSVVNSSFEVVYDTFVKQDNEVIDYNTRFSGVTQKDLANAKQTLREVQAVLLSMFSADSIIIGHCLENDLFALKIIHSTIIDTSIVFPHHLGLPHKRAFRNIVAEYLRHIIHEKAESHDSIGDARECVELMIWKVKEDAKGKRQ
eukprot:gi/632950517/ref/XP_007890767.1/ PREDICTED: RNA exonuclease 1 homolog isoform X2 [Callorhinchus milii]